MYNESKSLQIRESETFAKGCAIIAKAGYSIKDLTTETGYAKIAQVRGKMLEELNQLHKFKKRHEARRNQDMTFYYQSRINMLKKYYEMLAEG